MAQPTRRLPRILLAVVAVILVVIGGATAFVLLFDWNVARGYAGRFVSARLERPASIDGDLRVRWGRVTWIEADGVRLGNPDWASEPDMLRIERLAVAIDLLQLLRLRIALPEIRMVSPRLLLERGVDGAGNWQFNRVADAVTPESRGTMPVIDRMAIDDGAIVYRDQRRKLQIEAKAATIRGDASDESDRLEVCGAGKLQEQGFKFCLRGASILRLRNQNQPFPLEFALDAGLTALRAQGTARDPVALVGLDMRVEASGPDVAELLKLIAVPAPHTPPYRVNGRLGKEGDVWTLHELAGRIGGSDVGGTLAFDASGDRLRVNADLSSRRLDVADIGTLIGLPPLRSQQQQEMSAGQRRAAAAYRADPRLLPDAKLRIEELRAVDAKVVYRAQSVLAPGFAVDAASLDLTLEQGLLTIKPARFGIAGGRLEANVTIDARKDVVRTNYDIALSRFRLERLLQSSGLEGVGSGNVRGRIRLTGEGDSVRRSLATANGEGAVLVSGGELSLFAVELVGLDVFEALGVGVSDKSKPTPLRCAVIDFKVERGVVTPRSLVVDTGDSRIGGEGTASLETEALDLRFVPHPKDPSLFSLRTPVLVKGTFKKPSVGVEPGPLIARAGVAAALGVLLTPFAAILAFIDPGLGDDADCAGLEAAARQNVRPPSR